MPHCWIGAYCSGATACRRRTAAYGSGSTPRAPRPHFPSLGHTRHEQPPPWLVGERCPLYLLQPTRASTPSGAATRVWSGSPRPACSPAAGCRRCASASGRRRPRRSPSHIAIHGRGAGRPPRIFGAPIVRAGRDLDAEHPRLVGQRGLPGDAGQLREPKTGVVVAVASQLHSAVVAGRGDGDVAPDALTAALHVHAHARFSSSIRFSVNAQHTNEQLHITKRPATHGWRAQVRFTSREG